MKYSLVTSEHFSQSEMRVREHEEIISFFSRYRIVKTRLSYTGKTGYTRTPPDLWYADPYPTRLAATGRVRVYPQVRVDRRPLPITVLL